MLGDVSEDERTSIEKRLMTDPEYLGRLQLVETDLADDYASGALGRRERKRFERHFLSAPQHRQKLRVAAALRGYVARQRETTASDNRLRPLRWRLGSAGVFSLTAITLVLVAVIVGLVIQRGQMRRELQRFEALTRAGGAASRTWPARRRMPGSRQTQLSNRAVAELTRTEEGEVGLNDSGSNVGLDGRGNLRGLVRYRPK
jgi:hypothetical protein